MKLLTHWKLRLRLVYLKLLQRVGREILPEIYYVGSSETLPPPLTQDEEMFLLEKLKKGDGAVKTILIERNLRLVVYIARKFENTGIHIDDLVSIGTIGLIKAVNTLTRIKVSNWPPMRHKCIENEILMFLRRNNKVKLKSPLMNRLMWTGTAMNYCFPTFWERKMIWF